MKFWAIAEKTENNFIRLLYAAYGKQMMPRTWSWKRQPPNAQMQQKTKYSSYHSFGQSCGVFSGVRIHSSMLHSICRWLMSATGVIFLNRERMASRHVGTYLSKSIVRLAFSDCASRVSIQLLIYLQQITTLSTGANYFCGLDSVAVAAQMMNE